MRKIKEHNIYKGKSLADKLREKEESSDRRETAEIILLRMADKMEEKEREKGARVRTRKRRHHTVMYKQYHVTHLHYNCLSFPSYGKV